MPYLGILSSVVQVNLEYKQYRFSMASSDTEGKVRIGLIAGKALIFDLDDVKRLRHLGVGGVLTGTLPSAPQQNIFLGLPLQLMVEEVIWLVTNNYAYIVPDSRFISDIFDSLKDQDISHIQKERANSFQHQKRLKIRQLEEKEKASNRNQKNFTIPNDITITQSLMVDIPNNPNKLPNFDLFNKIYQNNEMLGLEILKTLRYDPLNYLVFSYLKEKNYFLAPGLRFGGKFIGYPGDPLRYHAHLIVNTFHQDQDIGLMNIVNGGRLATGVKKIWLIGSEVGNDHGGDNHNNNHTNINDDDDQNKVKEDDDGTTEVVCFSVEWAGFG